MSKPRRKIDRSIADLKVDSGVNYFAQELLEEVSFNQDHSETAREAFDAFSSSTVYRKVPAPELVLDTDVDPYQVELAIGKAATHVYGGDFMTVDMVKATESNRSSTVAINKIKRLGSYIDTQFVIVRNSFQMREAQTRRSQRISDAVEELARPRLNIFTLPAAPTAVLGPVETTGLVSIRFPEGFNLQKMISAIEL